MSIVFFEKNDGTGLSPGLWEKMPRDIWSNPAQAFTIQEDFLDPIITGDRWTIVETDGSWAHLLTEIGGVGRLTSGATDNDEGYLGGGAETVWGKMVAGSRPLAWEARFRINSIADLALYFGLAEEATAAANMLVDDTGAMVVKDTVGFHSLAATPATLSSVHATASGAQVVAGTAKTMVVDTWYKVGCYCDGKRNYWFVDGVVVAPTAGVLMGAANFPDGEEMSFAFGLKTGEAVTKLLDIDWVYFAQLRA